VLVPTNIFELLMHRRKINKIEAKSVCEMKTENNNETLNDDELKMINYIEKSKTINAIKNEFESIDQDLDFSHIMKN